MPKPINLSLTMTVSDPNGVCLSQTPAAGGVQAMVIAGALASGGVATMDVARHMLVTCAGSDAARTFTFTGTDRFGNTITEVIAGSAGTTTYGTKNFKTVTGINVDDDTAGAIIIGTADSLDSQWIVLNHHATEFNVGINCAVSSDIDATYGAEQTSSDVQAEGFLEDDAGVVTHATITAKTAAFQAQHLLPVRAIRFNVTDFVAGTLSISLIQTGV